MIDTQTPEQIVQRFLLQKPGNALENSYTIKEGPIAQLNESYKL